MSYEQLTIDLSTCDQDRYAVLEVSTGASTITISDAYLCPTAEQMALGEWNNSAGGNSGTAITYSRAQQQLDFNNEVGESGGDSQVETIWRGVYADYLAEVMGQIRAWEQGELEELPVLADPPAGVTLSYQTENC